MDTTTNALNWFEIPALDIDRAKRFYEDIFGFEMGTMDMKNNKMAFFPYAPGSGKASGALVEGEWYKPSQEGPLIYLNGNPDLATILGKVQDAGGSVVLYKTEIAEDIGYMAIFIDSEGNRVALHSAQ